MVEWPAGKRKPTIVLATVGEARRAVLARRVDDLEVLRAGDVWEATGWLRERDAIDAVIVDVELSEDRGTQVIVSGKAHGPSPIIALARDVRSLAGRHAVCLGARIYPREDSALALRDLVVPWRILAHVPAGLAATADSVALAHGLTRTQRDVLALLLAELTREEIAWITMCSLSAVRGVMARLAWRLRVGSALVAARRLRQAGLAQVSPPPAQLVTAPLPPT